MMQENDKTIFKKVDEALPRIFKNIEQKIAAAPNYTRVIVIGSSGASKSSLCNVLVGEQLTIEVNKHTRTYLTCPNPKFLMGHHMIAETSDPNIFVDDVNKLIYCDAPGFDDNRGDDQDIINSFSINQLFDENAKIKIIYVFSIHEGDISNGRGKNVAENMKRIFRMIPNENLMKEAMCLVISHGKKDEEKNLLKEFKSHPDPFFKKMIKYFYKNMNEKVFAFPEAKIKNAGEFYQFPDRERLINFLQTSPVSHLPHKVVLGDKAQNIVHNIVQNYGTIYELTLGLINKCKPMYDIQNAPLNVLNEWKMSYDQIVQKINSIKTPRDLAVLIEESIKHPELISQNVEKIRCYQSIFDFMNSIDDFSKNKIAIDKKVYSLFKNEMKLINEKINLINSNQKLKKTREENMKKSKEINTLQKEKAEQIQKTSELEGTICTLNCEIQKKDYENQTLSDRITSMEESVAQKISLANEYGRQIALLIKALKDGQERNDRELAEMRQQMAFTLNKYDKIISKMDENLRIESIGKYFGPLAPLYHLGVKIFDLIKGDSDDDDDDDYSYNYSFNKNAAIKSDTDNKYLKYDDDNDNE